MKTFSSRLGAVVFSLLLLFILLITSFEAVCYWTPNLYRDEFTKYDCLGMLYYYRGETMDLDGLDEVMDATMSFLRGDRDDLQVTVTIDGEEQEFYNEDEISHMTDVRNLFILFIRLRILAILAVIAIVVVFFRKFGKQAMSFLGGVYFRTCLIVFAVVLGFCLLVSTDFDKYFTIFHQIFFSQGNWMFDPRTSRMIDIMPEEFFMDIALRIIVTYLVSVVILLVPAKILEKKFREKKGN